MKWKHAVSLAINKRQERNNEKYVKSMAVYFRKFMDCVKIWIILGAFCICFQIKRVDTFETAFSLEISIQNNILNIMLLKSN